MDFYTYLLKSSAILGLFFLVDYFLLKKETTFNHNRYFLLFGIFCAIVGPFIIFIEVSYVESTINPIDLNELSMENSALIDDEAFDWVSIIFYTYLMGVIIMLVRFAVQLFGLLKVLKLPKRKDNEGFFHLELTENLSPFSFFNYIAYHLNSYDQNDLGFIIEHEKVHARQYHSIDVLLNQLLLVLLWFNPLAWYYQKRILENLEFIADRAIANQTEEQQKNYELTLLKVSTNYEAPSLANQFYQSLIKKRIVMLNKKSSRKYAFLKSAFILPLLGFFLWSFNVKEEIEYINQEEIEETINFQVYSTEILHTFKDFEVVYDKNTTIDQLNSDKKFLEDKFPIQITYSNVNFNRNNKLTSLTLEIKETKFNSSSIATTNNNGRPIKDKVFIMQSLDEDGRSRITAGTVSAKESKSKSFNKKNNSSNISKLLSENKKIVFNGNKKNLKELKNTIIKVSNYSVKNGIIHIKGEIIADYVDEMNGSQPKTFVKINEETRASVIQFSGVKVTSENKNNTIKTEESVSNSIVEKNPNKINASEFPEENNSVRYSGDQPAPLYIIDGKKADDENVISKINPDTIEKMNILKDKNAIEKYGEEGKYGVVEIFLKNEATSAHANQNIVEITKKDSKEDILKKENILIILDGEEISRVDMDELDPNSIKSVTVLKEKKAIKKYGKKANDGVILIDTK
ncbi:M56 family metallopeptidase [Mesonia aestuariivivens]|uniref:Peptidase M56 domain-containing protein n=1 Tax=Mesonia aestuariivivens TaxID=2796128 RepID=A0ABS6VZU7_9FLAO|nr:M56 family metallopeptidase [Mesonia aestuariivivens]MBW2961024.1 hypothetical protein [Mesonia aestuariivivens]